MARARFDPRRGQFRALDMDFVALTSRRAPAGVRIAVSLSEGNEGTTRVVLVADIPNAQDIRSLRHTWVDVLDSCNRMAEEKAAERALRAFNAVDTPTDLNRLRRSPSVGEATLTWVRQASGLGVGVWIHYDQKDLLKNFAHNHRSTVDSQTRATWDPVGALWLLSSKSETLASDLVAFLSPHAKVHWLHRPGLPLRPMTLRRNDAP